MAERCLGQLKAGIGALRISDDADLNFGQVANYWNEATKHTISTGTLKRRSNCIKNPAEFFLAASVRNVEVRDCERWAASSGPLAKHERFRVIPADLNERPSIGCWVVDWRGTKVSMVASSWRIKTSRTFL